MRNHRLLILPLIATAATLAFIAAGCIFDPPGEEPPVEEPVPIPPPTSPENLVKALEIIYDDKIRSATEREQAYENLLGPSFIFRFQRADYDSCGCQDWGRDEEIQTHRNIFQKQDSGEIYSLRLDIQFSPADSLNPPDPEKPGWTRILASNVFLELLTAPDFGWVVNGGQAEFLMQPLNGRWFIGDWTDLPRQ